MHTARQKEKRIFVHVLVSVRLAFSSSTLAGDITGFITEKANASTRCWRPLASDLSFDDSTRLAFTLLNKLTLTVSGAITLTCHMWFGCGRFVVRVDGDLGVVRVAVLRVARR